MAFTGDSCNSTPGYPYVNTGQANLDWMICAIKNLEQSDKEQTAQIADLGARVKALEEKA